MQDVSYGFFGFITMKGLLNIIEPGKQKMKLCRFPGNGLRRGRNKTIKLLERTKVEKSPGGYPVPLGLFYCPYCKQIVEKQITNGRRGKSCGCARFTHKNKSIPKKTEKYVSYIPENAKHKKAKQYAILHCKHYKKGKYSCLNLAFKSGKEIKCYRCEFFEEIKNAWHKELVAGNCRGEFDELTEYLINS